MPVQVPVKVLMRVQVLRIWSRFSSLVVYGGGDV